MVPTKELVYISANHDIKCLKEVPYPEFNSFFYSLDTFLPIVDLHQESYWIPHAQYSHCPDAPVTSSMANAQDTERSDDGHSRQRHHSTEGKTRALWNAIIQHVASHREVYGTLLHVFVWFEIIMGWVLTTLIITGLTSHLEMSHKHKE